MRPIGETGSVSLRRRFVGSLSALLLPIALSPIALPLAGCSDAEPGRAAAVAAPAAYPRTEVATAVVRRGEISQRITAPGSLQALRSSPIGAEVRGTILEVLVSDGDRVAAGDPLFQIDPEPYEVALQQARAGLDLARAERRQTAADLARARALLGKDVVSRQEVDRIETGLAVARAREKQAVQAVALAELNLRRTRVQAPYPATVAERRADEGTTALAQPQTIVVVLQEVHELEGRATIPEAHLARISVGDRARVRVAGLPEPLETTVSAVGDVVDPATRTYEVKMRVPNPDYRLKAGVFAEVEILPAPKPDVLLVPREALRTEDGRTRVLVVREGRAEARTLALGLVADDVAEVVSGLEAGEEVVVGEAAQTLAPGMEVRATARADAS